VAANYSILHTGPIKNDGRLGRNYLKGKSGDIINARLAAVGYNFRLILKWFKLLYVYFYFKNFCSKIQNNFRPKNFFINFKLVD